MSGYSTTELAKAIDSREGQWTSRDACLQQLSHRFRSSSLDAFSPEFKRILQGITAQLSDLRSQVVRSACTALSDMATAARDHVVLERPMREQLLPELLRLAGNGNTVLAGAARECLPVLFHNCHFEGMLKVICATLKESRHGAVRNLCCVAALSAIRTWPVHILESCAPLLESSLMVAATAAAVEVRSLARQCLAEYQHAFPAREDAIGCSLDSNLRGLLRQQSEELAATGGRGGTAIATEACDLSEYAAWSAKLAVETDPRTASRAPAVSAPRAAATSATKVSTKASTKAFTKAFTKAANVS